MEYMPYAIDYVTWNNKNYKTTQVKKFPKNVSKEILQSCFLFFAKDFFEEEGRVCYKIQEFCARMIKIFHEHEIYQIKSETERKEIEDFLMFHPETIELGKHHIDRDSFEITDDYVVFDIKPKASNEAVFEYYYEMIKRHKDFKDKKDFERIYEFVENHFKNTSAYKSKSEKERSQIINYFKQNYSNYAPDRIKLDFNSEIDSLFDIYFKDIMEKEIPNIFVLHSLNGDTLEMWGKQVKAEFENQTEVVMPKFPIRADSSYEKFKAVLYDDYSIFFKLTKDSIVICHSIANPYFIRYCKENNFVPKAYIAVAPGAVYEYPSSRNDYIVEVKKQAYLKPEELEFVKKNFDNVVCFYSDEDDGNKEKFERFISDTGADGIYLKGYNHFDGYHNIKEVPEIINKIKEFMKK